MFMCVCGMLEGPFRENGSLIYHIIVCHHLIIVSPTEIVLLSVDFRAEVEVWRRSDGAQH